MIVVVGERLNDLRRPAEAGVWADKDTRGARGDEAINEILRESLVDLADALGRPFTSVAPRVEDVNVEPVLVGGMADAAEAAPKLAAVRAAEVTDSNARRPGVGIRVGTDDAQYGRDEPIRAPAAPATIRRAVQHRVPGEVMPASRRELNAADEASGPGEPDGTRRPQLRARALDGRTGSGCLRWRHAPARARARG